MEQMRSEFEAYAANRLGMPLQMIIDARKGERYDHAFDSMNVMQPLTSWWTIWQASRQAIEMTFPTQVEYDDPLSAHRAINDCANIIRAAGLRIKGE